MTRPWIRLHASRKWLLVCLLSFIAVQLPAQGPSIEYHGGYLLSPAHVYFIWYGNWSGDTATIILPDLINGLNGSTYLNVLTSYSGKVAIGPGQDAFQALTNQVSLNGQVFDAYSHGSVIDDTTTKQIVTDHLFQFGVDPFGIYFVLTSPDVIQTSGSQQFCVDYCGYHGHTFRDNINAVYAFVGNPARCPSACMPQNVGPNDNAPADAMATVIAHEFAEAVTDVNGDAWYHIKPNPSGSEVPGEGEMGDLCEFPGTFNPVFVAGNGALANVTLGSRNFLLQSLFAATGGCTLSYTPPPPSTDPPPPPPDPGTGGGCSTVNPTGSTSPGTRPAAPGKGAKPANGPVNAVLIQC